MICALTEHGEPFGQFLGRPVEINVLFEPVKGDFHFISDGKIALSILENSGKDSAFLRGRNGSQNK